MLTLSWKCPVTHTRTRPCMCICVCAGLRAVMWLDGWIGQGVREGFKRGVDGRLMKMKE